MATTDGEGSSLSRMRGAARVVILDIVGPLVVFQLATAAGVADVWALVLSGFTPVIAVIADWVRWRTLEIVGAIVLGGIALSVFAGADQ